MTRRTKSILAMSLDDGRLSAVVVRAGEDRPRVEQRLSVPLSADPTASDPEPAGREIRELLDEAGVRERRCVVVLPAAWVLTLRVDAPELSGADLDSYLRLRAEREFPLPVEDMAVAASHDAGAGRATIAALTSSRLATLQRCLQAAKLKPLGFTVGVASLPFPASEGAVTLLTRDDGVDLAVSLDAHVAVLRRLPAGPNVASLARQLRISLGRLSAEAARTVRTVRIFGRPELARPLAEALGPHVDRLGLATETDLSETLGTEGADLDDAAPELVASGSAWLRGAPPELHFRPPIASRLRQATDRVSSRATVWLGGAVAAIFILSACAFLFQQVRLSRLESAWSRIEDKAAELQGIQTQVRALRPWFDATPDGLAAILCLTRAFPEDGAVWASMLEVRNASIAGAAVECSGKARNNGAWLAVLRRLRETDGVSDLRFKQVRGQNPLQFTLSFHWERGDADG